jgi:hypothetical protein
MFRSNTVFVVGAGASNEAGLPIGSELKQRITEKLYIVFENGFQQTKGDRNIVEAIRLYANSKQEDPNNYLRCCRATSLALPQAISIDNFLDAHQNDKNTELCGKLGIASHT